LLALWILYCAVHSILADASVKIWIEKFTGKWFRYYRLGYSLFAFATLAFLLLYQFSINSYLLFNNKLISFTIGIILILPGLYIMTVCIKKYFYELSGIQALENKVQKNTLQQSGLHKFVRHPLYFGTLLFVWGLFMIFPFLSNLIACITIQVYVLIGIMLEEKKLNLEYGKAYKDYVVKVPKLFPSLKNYLKK
jgi:protein-S-isoprenylcysteine O-methyltransferase Ste14